MKYSELISFKPIESTIQLLETAEKSAARDAVSTYVMSDSMAEGMQAPVIDQLQMEDVVDNKAIMVVGNFGTGKSHLMSVIAAIATDAENLKYLQNKKFASSMEIIAGKFEVLRMKVDGLTMPLREIIMGEIEDDFSNRSIDYEVPDLDSVRDNSRIIKDAMAKFQEKYPEKGYLIVIDELLSYLTSRDERQIVLDLAFLQSMAEMCSKSRLRVICGVQEKVFDNPRFSFVSETLKKVGDRFTQIIITKEATAYVVSERILKKTPEQKALIRKHLEKFTNLYTGMSSRLEEFVDLFPIHPSYIDVFNRIYLIENRHILKNISTCIRKIFDTNVPDNAPGIVSFDDYWPAIKSNGLLKSDVTISRVVNASQQLEDIINRAFPKPAYKPLAIQIIYALSVHRLTTNGLDVQFGMTAENLKDDLCLYLPMPEQDADFLLGTVNATLKSIMTTVSGQFIIFNDANNQYYIDVDKIVDYDEKVKQKAAEMEKEAQAAKQAAQALDAKAQKATQKAERAQQTVEAIRAKTRLREQQVSKQVRDAKLSIAEARRLRSAAEIAKTEARAAQRRYATLMKMEKGNKVKVSATVKSKKVIPVIFRTPPKAHKIAQLSITPMSLSDVKPIKKIQSQTKPKAPGNTNNLKEMQQMFDNISQQKWQTLVRPEQREELDDFYRNMDYKRLKFWEKYGNLVKGKLYTKGGDTEKFTGT